MTVLLIIRPRYYPPNLPDVRQATFIESESKLKCQLGATSRNALWHC